MNVVVADKSVIFVMATDIDEKIAMEIVNTSDTAMNHAQKTDAMPDVGEQKAVFTDENLQEGRKGFLQPDNAMKFNTQTKQLVNYVCCCNIFSGAVY